MEQCYFLWTYQLPGGTCAQWFSGTASTLAVIVALGAHFYAAWRQRKVEARQDAAEVAGISMTLRIALNEVDANANLFAQGCKSVTLWKVKYTLSSRFGAISAARIERLDKNQADVLIRLREVELAEKIDTLVGKINLVNLGIEDYARIRADLSVILDKYPDINPDKIVDEVSEDAKLLKKKIRVASNSAEHFLQETRDLFQEALSIVSDYNRFCSGSRSLERYRIESEWYTERLDKMQPNPSASGSTK